MLSKRSLGSLLSLSSMQAAFCIAMRLRRPFLFFMASTDQQLGLLVFPCCDNSGASSSIYLRRRKTRKSSSLLKKLEEREEDSDRD